MCVRLPGWLPTGGQHLVDLIVAGSQIFESIKAQSVSDRVRIPGILGKVVVDIHEHGPAGESGFEEFSRVGIHRTDAIAIEIVPDSSFDVAPGEVEETGLGLFSILDNHIPGNGRGGSPTSLDHFGDAIGTRNQPLDGELAIDISQSRRFPVADVVLVISAAVVEIDVNPPVGQGFVIFILDAIRIDVLDNQAGDHGVDIPLEDIGHAGGQ